MKILTVGFASLAAIALELTVSVAPSRAAGATFAQPSLEQITNSVVNVRDMAPNWVTPMELEEAVRGRLVDKVDHAVDVHAGTLDRGAAQALAIDGYAAVVTVPLVGDGLDVGSSVVGFFTDAHELLDLVELHFLLDNSGGGSVSTWQDNIAATRVVLSGDQVEQVMNDAGYTVNGKSYIDKLSACLASKGVPQAMLNLAAGLCAISCAITAGAACIVCLAAYLVGWGVTTTACINEVNAGKWG